MGNTTLSTLARHYLQGTVRKSRKLLNMPKQQIPYMKFKEIDLMLDVLAQHKPLRVLEYGCGFSTLYFPTYLPKEGEWISIEHDREWYLDIQDQLEKASHTTLFHVDAEQTEWKAEGDYSSFQSYVDFPQAYGPFDMILVDGMAREACIDNAQSMLAENGLLVVHDCNRPVYHPHVQQYPYWLILQDFRKTSGGLGVASSGVDPNQLLDIEKYRSIWHIDSAINNFFKFKFLLGKKGKPFQMLQNT